MILPSLKGSQSLDRQDTVQASPLEVLPTERQSLAEHCWVPSTGSSVDTSFTMKMMIVNIVQMNNAVKMIAVEVIFPRPKRIA